MLIFSDIVHRLEIVISTFRQIYSSAFVRRVGGIDLGTGALKRAVGWVASGLVLVFMHCFLLIFFAQFLLFLHNYYSAVTGI